MDKAKELDGKDFMLFLKNDSTSEYKVTALASGCKISLSAETKDTSSKDSGFWKDSKIVGMSWNMTTDNAVTMDSETQNYEAIRTAFLKGEPVMVGCGVPTNTATDYPTEGWITPDKVWGGQANITSLELTANKGDTCTFSATFEGVGKFSELTTAKA